RTVASSKLVRHAPVVERTRGWILVRALIMAAALFFCSQVVDVELFAHLACIDTPLISDKMAINPSFASPAILLVLKVFLNFGFDSSSASELIGGADEDAFHTTAQVQLTCSATQREERLSVLLGFCCRAFVVPDFIFTCSWLRDFSQLCSN
ncbi:MAG: hypothetical protein K2Q09_03095, partial [Phycisphaerales bacterium]|nr:hypothetical protein [Phycisphaerales bacterium]